MPTEQAYETTEDRLDAIEALGIPMAGIERFLKSRDLRVPAQDEHFNLKVAEQVTGQEFQELVYQHKYAGRQTVNYFIITGISDHSLDEIQENVLDRFPSQDEIGQIPKEPFVADTEVLDGRLYLPFGYYEYAGSEDPVTGTKKGVLITKRVVVVVTDDFDLVEFRGSNTNMVEEIRDEFCKSLGKYQPSVKKRPQLGSGFQDRFNELVELYYNLKVKVDDQENSTLDTISFTSREDEEGERKDARSDERVETELEERGGEITMGYVKLTEGFKFRLNRDLAKLSFMKFEREENLNAITNIVDDVLREAGEYTQDQISGIEDVPE